MSALRETSNMGSLLPFELQNAEHAEREIVSQIGVLEGRLADLAERKSSLVRRLPFALRDPLLEPAARRQNAHRRG